MRIINSNNINRKKEVYWNKFSGCISKIVTHTTRANNEVHKTKRNTTISEITNKCNLCVKIKGKMK